MSVLIQVTCDGCGDRHTYVGESADAVLRNNDAMPSSWTWAGAGSALPGQKQLCEACGPRYMDFLDIAKADVAAFRAKCWAEFWAGLKRDP